MNYAVIKGTSYVLVNSPDMIVHNGTTQTMEKITNPHSEYLKEISKHIRPFEKVVSYPPNQTYIGNMTPEELRAWTFPWYDKSVDACRYGKFGEIMPQDEFIGLMKLADAFELVKLNKEITKSIKEKFAKHPLFENEIDKLQYGDSMEEIEEIVNDLQGEGIYNDGKLVGSVKKAHDIDGNLTAHVLFENLVVKASGILAFKNLLAKNDVNVKDIDYVIECSEEACGDMNQRGGGNFAKSIAEVIGAINATGSDTRGFCAAPTHALIEAAALVQAGIYKNVVVVAGGATAKLGMNGKDHVKKGIPVLEDVLGGFAVLVSENDGVSPIIRTDILGRHTVGTGSSPQAVMTALITNPLDKAGLKITDIDKYSVEMQNPDVTKPAGAGDVPEANYRMIGALGVKKKHLERKELLSFIKKHGMPGWAPTQGHIPSGVPYLGFAREALTEGDLNKVMIIAKGSLFLGRMTNQFDGVSVVIERNVGAKKKVVAKVFDNEVKTLISDSIQTGKVGKKIRIALTTMGSDHGIENLLKAAELASKTSDNVEVVLIGQKMDTELSVVEVNSEIEMYSKMEELLDSGEIQGCVTMHYNFPVGVSTVGRAITPGRGKEMFLSTTTGTSAVNRVEAMVRNTLHGIITAKAMGIKAPTIGILNLDGARQVERILKELNSNGYEINFVDSVRSHGGSVMRGNDLLAGTADVMVTDTLTGNIMMKVLSAYTTGGNYEASGYGYGPGIGDGYERNILIVSRASGVPVVANAIKYAASLAKGKVVEISKDEFKKAKEANLEALLAAITKEKKQFSEEQVTAPAKQVVTGSLSGIDIMELEDAVKTLWKNGIYAESGMGCTGPIVMINETKVEEAREVLRREGFI